MQKTIRCAKKMCKKQQDVQKTRDLINSNVNKRDVQTGLIAYVLICKSLWIKASAKLINVKKSPVFTKKKVKSTKSCIT